MGASPSSPIETLVSSFEKLQTANDRIAMYSSLQTVGRLTTIEIAYFEKVIMPNVKTITKKIGNERADAIRNNVIDAIFKKLLEPGKIDKILEETNALLPKLRKDKAVVYMKTTYH